MQKRLHKMAQFGAQGPSVKTRKIGIISRETSSLESIQPTQNGRALGKSDEQEHVNINDKIASGGMKPYVSYFRF